MWILKSRRAQFVIGVWGGVVRLETGFMAKF